MSTLDLFAEPQASTSLVGGFDTAWKDWLAGEKRAGRLQQASSEEVYGAMWSALSAWCIGNGIALDSLTSEDLERFLNSRGGRDDISNRHAWRFLRLVDRVLASRSRASSSSQNHAAAQLMELRPEYRLRKLG
jgi:hypothetical protein